MDPVFCVPVKVRPNATAVDRGPPFRVACSGCSATWSAEHHRVKQVGEDGLTCRTERCDKVHEISLSCSSRRWWQKSKSGLSVSTYMHYHLASTREPSSARGSGVSLLI